MALDPCQQAGTCWLSLGTRPAHFSPDKRLPWQDFYDLSPSKFQNKTNGVTPRRWLAYCNPRLAALITQTLGNAEWIKHADQLQACPGLACRLSPVDANIRASDPQLLSDKLSCQATD